MRNKIEEGKREHNKKLAQIYRELEKNQLCLERKVSIEDLNERLEGKADKQMVVNGLLTKSNRGDLE